MGGGRPFPSVIERFGVRGRAARPPVPGRTCLAPCINSPMPSGAEQMWEEPAPAGDSATSRIPWRRISSKLGESTNGAPADAHTGRRHLNYGAGRRCPSWSLSAEAGSREATDERRAVSPEGRRVARMARGTETAWINGLPAPVPENRRRAGWHRWSSGNVWCAASDAACFGGMDLRVGPKVTGRLSDVVMVRWNTRRSICTPAVETAPGRRPDGRRET